MEKPIHYIRICRYLLILTPILGTMVTSTLLLPHSTYYLPITIHQFPSTPPIFRQKSFHPSLLLEILCGSVPLHPGGELSQPHPPLSLVDALMEFKEEGGSILPLLVGGTACASLHMRTFRSGFLS